MNLSKPETVLETGAEGGTLAAVRQRSQSGEWESCAVNAFHCGRGTSRFLLPETGVFATTVVRKREKSSENEEDQAAALR